MTTPCSSLDRLGGTSNLLTSRTPPLIGYVLLDHANGAPGAERPVADPYSVPGARMG
jgi:hypothetical protein